MLYERKVLDGVGVAHGLRLASGGIPHTFSGIAMQFVNSRNPVRLSGDAEHFLHGEWLLEFPELAEL